VVLYSVLPWHWQHHLQPVRFAYQPPASSTFLSEQISHQQPVSNTFLSEQTSTRHQPPAERTRWPRPGPWIPTREGRARIHCVSLICQAATSIKYLVVVVVLGYRKTGGLMRMRACCLTILSSWPTSMIAGPFWAFHPGFSAPVVPQIDSATTPTTDILGSCSVQMLSRLYIPLYYMVEKQILLADSFLLLS
jgi:hypothetical protein